MPLLLHSSRSLLPLRGLFSSRLHALPRRTFSGSHDAMKTNPASSLELPWSKASPGGSWSVEATLVASPESENGEELSEVRMEQLADLVNLGLPTSAALRDDLRKDLESILRFGDIVTEARAAHRNDGRSSSPSSHQITPLRNDEVTEGGNKDDLLRNAAKAEDGHFVVYQKRP
mmetsp:Transcript_12323/g.23939  ORF Transcript_12323/g.23939 Transcript_12323/m.23939 type:complete len:174 (-) Transcript_12323:892-1413(-)